MTQDEEDLGGSCSSLGTRDCWICYDSERNEPLIQPCKCTGDVSSVHHDCLRRWLVEVINFLLLLKYNHY